MEHSEKTEIEETIHRKKRLPDKMKMYNGEEIIQILGSDSFDIYNAEYSKCFQVYLLLKVSGFCS